MNQIVYLLLDGNNRYDVSGDRVRIGSANDNEIVVSAEIISAHHVEIFREGRRWFLRDLNSTYGVWMNGTRIPAGEKQQLMNEDEIQLSQALRIRFMIEESRKLSDFSTPAGAASVPARQPAFEGEVRKQGAGEPKEAKRKKSRKKGWIILLILLILAAAAVPGWCGVQHYLGSKALEAGDYEDAIACFEKDFLFSDGWIEATIRSAGDAASAAGDYVTAQSWYARLDGGSDWADAVYEQALNTEDPQERIEILEQIAEEKRAQEQIGKAKLELAEQLLAEGKYSEALAMAESIGDRTLADVDEFLNRLWHVQGNLAVVENQDLSEAIECFENCAQDTLTETQLSILYLLRDGNYAQAAQEILSALENDATEFSLEEWTALLRATLPEGDPKSLAEYLDILYAENLLSEETAEDDLLNGIKEMIPTGELASGVGGFQNAYPCESLEALEKTCGTAADGKILIIGQYKDYTKEKMCFAILTDLMNLLPEERIPESPEEVEYLIVLNYTYSAFPNFEFSNGGGGARLQEKGNVLAYHLPDGARIDSTRERKGEAPPDYHPGKDSHPDAVTGGVPDLSEDLYKVLKDILE